MLLAMTTSVVGTGAAYAATLGGATGDAIAAGSAPIVACDTDGFTVTHILAATKVDQVTVGAIDSACAGGQLTVTLTDLADVSFSTGGPVVVPTDGGSITIDVIPDQEQADVKEHHLGVVGP